MSLAAGVVFGSYTVLLYAALKMNVIGRTENGSIKVEIDGNETFVSDDMGNRYPQAIV